jgi:hypothetical protein
MNINNFKALISQGRLVDATELSSEDLLIVGRYIQGTRNVDQYPDFVVSAKQLATLYRSEVGYCYVNGVIPYDFIGTETQYFLSQSLLTFPNFANAPDLIEFRAMAGAAVQKWVDLSNTKLKIFVVNGISDFTPYITLTTFDGLVFPNTIEDIDLQGDIDDYIDVNSSTFSNLKTLSFINSTLLSQANVDAQLQSVYDLVTGPHNSNSFTTLDLSGGTISPPSPAGVIIANNLIALGITVATN